MPRLGRQSFEGHGMRPVDKALCHGGSALGVGPGVFSHVYAFKHLRLLMAILVLVSWLKSLRSAGLWVAQPGGVLAGRQAAPGGGFTSGGAAWHIRLTNVFDLPSIDVATAPAAPTARAYTG